MTTPPRARSYWEIKALWGAALGWLFTTCGPPPTPSSAVGVACAFVAARHRSRRGRCCVTCRWTTTRACARPSAVCREMRFAADADALWSARFEATFGAEAARKARERERRREGTKRSNENDADAYDHALHWKRLFAEATVAARMDALARKRARDLAERNGAEWFAPRFPRPGVPEGGVPLGPPGYTPGITGGDYDLYCGRRFGSFMPGFPGGFPGSGFPGPRRLAGAGP